MSTFNKSLGNEPRNYFVTTLIQITRDLRFLIFEQRATVANIFPAIKGVIMILSEDAQNDLEPLNKKLDDWRNNRKRYRPSDLEDAYGELMRYLHKGYLKEVNYATPKFGEQAIELREGADQPNGN